MPTEAPQSDSQENSSDAWQKAHDTKHAHSSSHQDLKDFFGGEPHPVRETDDDEEAFLKSLEGDAEPQQDAPPGDEPDVDWSKLDDEGFIDQLSSMEPAFAGPKTRSQKAEPTPSDEFSWDEFRATHPDEAAEAELHFSPDSLQGATFKKKKSGFMTATLQDGRRLLYMGDNRGWFDMDDEGSPTGEF